MKEKVKDNKELVKNNTSKNYESNFLLNGERLDDLQFNGLRIIQNKDLYCFSSDAILLCNFIKAKRTDTIVDFCSGSGVVGILAQAKTGAKNLIMVEKQKELVNMCKRSLLLNNINNAEVICCDVKNAFNFLKNNLGITQVDVVCANPPYYLPSQKKLSGNKKIDMAKFELTLNLNSLCKSASKILKFGGKFYMINDSERISEILTALVKFDLQPKTIEFIFSKHNSNSNVVLIEAVKCGNPGTKVYYKCV